MAVPSCAGAYVAGAAGSNECPAGSVRIEAEAACRTAAAAVGKAAGVIVESMSNFPRGCYFWTGSNSSNYAFLNNHSVGAGNPDSQLLCTATTGARVCREARAQGWRRV